MALHQTARGVVRTGPLLLVTALQLAGAVSAQGYAEADESQAEMEHEVTAGSNSVAAPSKPPLRIALSWCDPHRLFSFEWGRVGDEVRHAFAQIGVEMEWRRGPLDSREEDGFLHVQVLLVRSEPRQWGLPPDAMGAVLSRTGIERHVYVFFPSVARSLGYHTLPLMGRWPNAREGRALAIALGRVVVHEVVHALVPSAAHADAGLTQEKLHRELLLGPQLEIDPATAQALRDALGQRRMLSP